jgi:hypothetical protein
VLQQMQGAELRALPATRGHPAHTHRHRLPDESGRHLAREIAENRAACDALLEDVGPARCSAIRRRLVAAKPSHWLESWA